MNTLTLLLLLSISSCADNFLITDNTVKIIDTIPTLPSGPEEEPPIELTFDEEYVVFQNEREINAKKFLKKMFGDYSFFNYGVEIESSSVLNSGKDYDVEIEGPSNTASTVIKIRKNILTSTYNQTITLVSSSLNKTTGLGMHLPFDVGLLNVYDIDKTLTQNKLGDTCIITLPSKEVLCYKNNNNETSYVLEDASGIIIGVEQISMGFGFGCLVTQTGRVGCWGKNDSGQLGNGGWTDSSLVVWINSSVRFKKVSSGYSHACGISKTDEAYCWGGNWDGQIGVGGTGDKVVPVVLTSLGLVRDVEVGNAFSCFVSQNKSVACFGNNDYGQLCTGDKLNDSSVVKHPNFTGINKLAKFKGESVCGIKDNGAMVCCGNNVGQLLTDSPSDLLQPTEITKYGTNNAQVVINFSNICSVKENGQVYCSGYNTKKQVNSSSDAIVVEPFLMQ